MLNFSGWPRRLGSPFNWPLKKSPKWDVSLNLSPRGPPTANLDKEPLNIMGDWNQVERKPTLKPPVVELWFFSSEKTLMFQINDDLDIYIILLSNILTAPDDCSFPLLDWDRFFFSFPHSMFSNLGLQDATIYRALFPWRTSIGVFCDAESQVAAAGEACWLWRISWSAAMQILLKATWFEFIYRIKKIVRNLLHLW